MIDEYLRELAVRLPSTRRRRVLAEAEDHLRESAAALVAKGLEPAAAEEEAVRSFGPPEHVAGRIASVVARVAVRRAAVVGLFSAGALVLPLYGIPENTLPPAPWTERPPQLSLLLDAGVACWLAAIGLAVAAVVLAGRRPRASALALIGCAVAVGLASLAAAAALAVWLAEAEVSTGWQPALAVPAAVACVTVAGAAALWARARARIASA